MEQIYYDLINLLSSSKRVYSFHLPSELLASVTRGLLGSRLFRLIFIEKSRQGYPCVSKLMERMSMLSLKYCEMLSRVMPPLIPIRIWGKDIFNLAAVAFAVYNRNKLQFTELSIPTASRTFKKAIRVSALTSASKLSSMTISAPAFAAVHASL